MRQHLFKATALVLAAVAVLSSVSTLAGDYRREHRPFHHSGPHRLQEISWPQRSAQPQPDRIVLMDPQYAADVGTYAGTADVYRANDGTYVLGYGGYDRYPDKPATRLRPRAQVIDIKLAGNACAYEAGVCVIRP
ncbi:hypothetical protein [Rhizobium rhizogenes]|uniref:hypothetical protein n=1 Tax=Rhizobium rhizogenes TaxID=359 RepID=UPI0015743DDB|nr:hypothetical protein [Rhizobium rhizogenes]NTF69668.1 hypothetical protein [Rhizobium rhizogenes]NTI36282.1 hypothetical protein [Rhizobium rhizogenes]WEO64234.1 hypothetical protein G6L54_014285 [Rhizobium rhizogenes]